MSISAILAERVADAPDLYDHERALNATGLLAAFNAAGVLAAADVHVATTLARLGAEPDESVALAAALACRGVRLGSVCVELATLQDTVAVDGVAVSDIAALPWPDRTAWPEACLRSPIVGTPSELGPARPLRFDRGLLYLDRYWRQEQLIRDELALRAEAPAPFVDVQRLAIGLARLFPGEDAAAQRVAAAVSATRWVTVLAGGPGTGKTTTIARILALLCDQPGSAPRIALAAPTGKAATRLEEAVHAVGTSLDPHDGAAIAGLRASTLHRLLGGRPDSRTRFRHDRNNHLPFDVVVVDETSMVSLTMMARLLEAMRADARLILVGDPDQLASVEAGAVLGDLVHRPGGTPWSGELVEVLGRSPVDAPALRSVQDEQAQGDSAPAEQALPREVATTGSEPPSAGVGDGVVVLTHIYRFGSAIAQLAAAIRRGDDDEVMALLRAGADAVRFTDLAAPSVDLADVRADVTSAAAALVEAGRRGAIDDALATLSAHRLLCAHREGPFGVTQWSDRIDAWLAASIDGYAAEGEWYAGRPLLVTANDYDLGLFNGDAGVVVERSTLRRSEVGTNRASGHAVVAAFERAGGALLVSPHRLSAVQTVHAMTVHKSQGSQFDRVTLVLPGADSALLTRELLYTAVTRARTSVHVVGTDAGVRLAATRPVARASGLRSVASSH